MSNDALLSSVSYVNFFLENGKKRDEKLIKTDLMSEKGSSLSEADINYFFNNYEIIHQ
ncbi:hypothetical protein [Gallibacterium anatis]